MIEIAGVCCGQGLGLLNEALDAAKRKGTSLGEKVETKAMNLVVFDREKIDRAQGIFFCADSRGWHDLWAGISPLSKMGLRGKVGSIILVLPDDEEELERGRAFLMKRGMRVDYSVWTVESETSNSRSEQLAIIGEKMITNILTQ